MGDFGPAPGPLPIFGAHEYGITVPRGLDILSGVLSEESVAAAARRLAPFSELTDDDRRSISISIPEIAARGSWITS
jgi:hypothetical protein